MSASSDLYEEAKLFIQIGTGLKQQNALSTVFFAEQDQSQPYITRAHSCAQRNPPLEGCSGKSDRFVNVDGVSVYHCGSPACVMYSTILSAKCSNLILPLPHNPTTQIGQKNYLGEDMWRVLFLFAFENEKGVMEYIVHVKYGPFTAYVDFHKFIELNPEFTFLGSCFSDDDWKRFGESFPIQYKQNLA